MLAISDFERQRIQDEGDVGGMEPLELAAQLGEVLLVHQLLDQPVLGHVLLPVD